MESKEKFSYTYSAPTEEERREIESIRRQYKPESKEESNIDRLRRLHSKVVGSATALSLALGIIGILTFGGGLALTLELGMPVVGIILSLIGVAPIALAYPVYNMMLEKGKKRYGEEIIRLSDSLLSEE